jgi:transposase-like protein
METMGRKQPRARRSFTAEFKAEIVELCQRGDRSIGQVTRDFDLTETASGARTDVRCTARALGWQPAPPASRPRRLPSP